MIKSDSLFDPGRPRSAVGCLLIRAQHEQAVADVARIEQIVKRSQLAESEIYQLISKERNPDRRALLVEKWRQAVQQTQIELGKFSEQAIRRNHLCSQYNNLGCPVIAGDVPRDDCY